MRRKRTKQLITILLSITLIALATAKPYQEAKATGLEGGLIAGGAGAAMSNPVSFLILAGIVGGVCIVAESGKRGDIDKAAERAKEDFVRYSTQALNNKISADEQERDNAAHASAVIDDWLESASAGVIDTTSEAWDWCRNYVSDIRSALSGGSGSNPNVKNGYVGSVLDGVYTDLAVLTPTKEAAESGTKDYSISYEFKGLDMSGISDQCFLALKAGGNVLKLCVAKLLSDGTMAQVPTAAMSSIAAQYRVISEDGTVGRWRDFGGELTLEWHLQNYTLAAGLPLLVEGAKFAAPSGTTDVPGVSNVNDYVSIGSDLPYTRPEGAWDICDPNGKKGQVSIGQDIPANLGYDDWYDVLGGVANGDTTWEQVANASDVIRIGSDTDSPYSSDNADAWGAYVDGTIIGYDVTAEGDVVITLEGGKVITIPQEYAGSIEFTNEQDKAQELDKDTVLPVTGVISYPLPAAIDSNPAADPDTGGGGGGSVTVDPDVSDYTLDFRKLFPFCIPFDIYKAVKLLDATPTAPVVHYKFYFSKSKTYTIDLNLNIFNTVAAILRRMECLLFIIGLATATRRIYIRG